jgi:hypothetical protein
MPASGAQKQLNVPTKLVPTSAAQALKTHSLAKLSRFWCPSLPLKEKILSPEKRMLILFCHYMLLSPAFPNSDPLSMEPSPQLGI